MGSLVFGIESKAPHPNMPTWAGPYCGETDQGDKTRFRSVKQKQLRGQLLAEKITCLIFVSQYDLHFHLFICYP
jgi:hypothetical protein